MAAECATTLYLPLAGLKKLQSHRLRRAPTKLRSHRLHRCSHNDHNYLVSQSQQVAVVVVAVVVVAVVVEVVVPVIIV